MPKRCNKGRDGNRFFVHRYLPITFGQIDFCQEFCLSYLIYEVIDAWHRKSIWNCDLIKFSIVNRESECFVRFLCTLLCRQIFTTFVRLCYSSVSVCVCINCLQTELSVMNLWTEIVAERMVSACSRDKFIQFFFCQVLQWHNQQDLVHKANDHPSHFVSLKRVFQATNWECGVVVHMLHYNSGGKSLFSVIDLEQPANVSHQLSIHFTTLILSLIHIWRCRRIERCRSRWSPYH